MEYVLKIEHMIPADGIEVGVKQRKEAGCMVILLRPSVKEFTHLSNIY